MDYFLFLGQLQRFLCCRISFEHGPVGLPRFSRLPHVSESEPIHLRKEIASSRHLRPATAPLLSSQRKTPSSNMLHTKSSAVFGNLAFFLHVCGKRQSAVRLKNCLEAVSRLAVCKTFVRAILDLLSRLRSDLRQRSFRLADPHISAIV